MLANRLTFQPLLSLANVPLKVLDASRNEITNDDADTPLPDSCALARNLSELDMSGNRLIRIPRSLFGLQALRSVTLARNELSGDLGRGWASLLALEALNLADNRLGALGDVHKAPVLRTLDLGNNCLRSVPPELGLCDCLRSDPARQPAARHPRGNAAKGYAQSASDGCATGYPWTSSSDT